MERDGKGEGSRVEPARTGDAAQPKTEAPSSVSNPAYALGLQRKLQRRRAQRKQASAVGDDSSTAVHDAAERGTRGAGGALPHLDTIQKSFGHHDVGGVNAHTGSDASEAARSIGAEAFATGNDVAFGDTPSLHTAAHEAAHVVQQRSGVHLKGGVGQEGDPYEQHADAVADAVVAGRSAESLLDTHVGTGAASSRAVMRKETDVNGGCFPS